MNDPIRKYQFEHNENTCLTSNFPEIFVDKNGEKIDQRTELEVAPAEGNKPTNILTEKTGILKAGHPCIQMECMVSIIKEKSN